MFSSNELVTGAQLTQRGIGLPAGAIEVGRCCSQRGVAAELRRKDDEQGLREKEAPGCEKDTPGAQQDAGSECAGKNGQCKIQHRSQRAGVEVQRSNEPDRRRVDQHIGRERRNEEPRGRREDHPQGNDGHDAADVSESPREFTITDAEIDIAMLHEQQQRGAS